jgi:hypothetical protein
MMGERELEGADAAMKKAQVDLGSKDIPAATTW